MGKKSYQLFNIISLIFLIFVIISPAICAGCRIKEREAKTEKSEGQDIGIVSGEGEEEKEENEEKGEVERGKEEMPEVIYISPEEVYEVVNSSQISDYIILDVRTAREFKEGHIAGAVLIPVSELENRLGELSKDKSIIVYCRSAAEAGAQLIFW
jgi:hypothetical protein